MGINSDPVRSVEGILYTSKMLSALRTGAVKSVLNGQGSFKVLAVTPSRDFLTTSYPPGYQEIDPEKCSIKNGYSPMGHKIPTRPERVATWKYVNSVFFGPERDMKNFPTPVTPDTAPPVRFGVIPASWFEMLYPKMGVSGPYTLLGGFALWMMSKEHMVMDHWFWEFPSFWGSIFFLHCHPSIGPKLKAYVMKFYDDLEDAKFTRPIGRMRASAEKDVAKIQRLIEETELHGIVKTAKEEGVGLQLEAAYRSRLQHVYSEVKKRLDYESEKAALKKQFEQDHMVNWIVNSVTKSITPQQEKDSIKSCIQALKNLQAA